MVAELKVTPGTPPSSCAMLRPAQVSESQRQIAQVFGLQTVSLVSFPKRDVHALCITGPFPFDCQLCPSTVRCRNVQSYWFEHACSTTSVKVWRRKFVLCWCGAFLKALGGIRARRVSGLFPLDELSSEAACQGAGPKPKCTSSRWLVPEAAARSCTA